MDRHFQAVTGYSFIERTGLFAEASSPEALPDVWPIAITLPAIAMVQMAMFDLLKSVGISPDICIGHSAGETAMLYASGAGSREMALELAIARGLSFAIAEYHGTMAALACTPHDARLIIDSLAGESSEGTLDIACYNSHESITLSGTEQLIDRAVYLAQQKGFFARKLRTNVPIHSALMEVCAEDYHTRVNAVFARHPGDHKPQITTYSTLNGTLWNEEFTADYFWATTRNPVMFTPAISLLVQSFPTATFVEIAPHPVLSSYLSAMGAVASSVLCTMRRVKVVRPFGELVVFLETIGSLATLGCNTVDFQALNATDALTTKISLPPYPFTKKEVPYQSEDSIIVRRQMEDRNGPLNYSNMRLNAATHPILAQHIIQGEPIMPAAGYIEMVSMKFQMLDLY